MIEKALKYIVGMRKAEQFEIDGRKYTDKEIYPIKNPQAGTLQSSTLTSIIDYIASKEKNEGFIIEIQTPDRVILGSKIFGDFKQREKYLQASANLPRINFGDFVTSENFIIDLQAKFTNFRAQNEDGTLIETDGHTAELLAIAGNLSSQKLNKFSDDGVTQTTEVRTGIVNTVEAVIPNPVTLAPFRTFPEIEQVPSEFIFRMKEGQNGIVMALIEAAGGAWEAQTIQRIKHYLTEQLHEKGIRGITILA